MASLDPFSILMETAGNLIRDKGVELYNEQIGEVISLIIKKDGVEVGRANVAMSVVSVVVIPTRSKKEDELNTIRILNINIDKYYRGNSLATLLLIYGICYLKVNDLEGREASYVTLDDDSDMANSVNNVYAQLGFSFKGTIVIDDKTEQVVDSSTGLPGATGNEKQVSIETFRTIAVAQLKKIEKKMTQAAGDDGFKNGWFYNTVKKRRRYKKTALKEKRNTRKRKRKNKSKKQ